MSSLLVPVLSVGCVFIKELFDSHSNTRSSITRTNQEIKMDFDTANSPDPSKHMAPPFDISDFFGDFAGGFGFPGAIPGADPAAPADAA